MDSYTNFEQEKEKSMRLQEILTSAVLRLGFKIVKL